MLPSFEAVV